MNTDKIKYGLLVSGLIVGYQIAVDCGKIFKRELNLVKLYN